MMERESGEDDRKSLKKIRMKRAWIENKKFENGKKVMIKVVNHGRFDTIDSVKLSVLTQLKK